MKFGGLAKLISGILVLATATLSRAQSPERLPEPSSVVRRGNMDQAPPDDGSMDARGMGVDSRDMNDGRGEYDQAGPPQGPAEEQYTDGGPPCESAPPYPFSSGQWWKNGCWYGEFDFLVWHRGRAHDGILGIDTSVATGGQRDLNRHGTPISLEPGGEGTLGYILDRDLDNRDHSIEFSYLGFNNFASNDSLNALTPGSLRVVQAPDFGGFNFADRYSDEYHSSLQTMEVNYRIQNRPEHDRMVMGPDGFWSRQLTPGRTQSLLIGLVGVQSNEDFHWLSTQDGVSPAVFSGDLRTHTENTLLGVQTGGDCMDLHEGWFWGIRGKAGIFANFSRAAEDILVNDPNTPESPVHGHTTDQTPAFWGRLSFLSGFNLTDNITLFGSYDLALLGGIAMAPDQVKFSNGLAGVPPTIHTSGEVFYNGLSFGLQAYW